MTIRLALMGATNDLAREVLTILEERLVDLERVHALDARHMVGHPVSFGDATLKVEDAESFEPTRVDAAIVCAGGDLARTQAPRLAKAGVVVIDLTDTHRLDPRVPLVLPEVNAHLLDTLPASRMVACPGPAAAMVAASLAPLHTRWTARRVVVSTYQSVLDTGREGMDELWSQTRGIFVNDPPTREVFEKQIAFNVLPRVGDTMNSGATTAEFGLVAELKRLIDPRLKVAASCVRVPVFAASGATVVAEFEDEIAVADARAELREAPALMVVDKSDDDGFVTPVETVGEFATFVSRVREDSSVDNGLAWWVTADDLRKGSALLGVEILERLVANGLVRRLG